MASFLPLDPPDNVVFGATRPVEFWFDDGSGGAIITGTVNINTLDVAVITASTVNNVNADYVVTETQPGGAGTNRLYTVTPVNGWVEGTTYQVVISSSSPVASPAVRTFTVGEGYTGDHTATALNRLLDQFANSTSLKALLSSYVDQVQALEDVASRLLHERGVDTASGDRLDGLGEIAGVKRSGLDDIDYRKRVRAELAVLRSQGTLDDLFEIVSYLEEPENGIEAKDYYPKTVYLRLTNHILEQDPVMVASLLRRAVSAATQLLFVYSLQLDAATFTLSSQAATSETSSLLGLANTAQSTGGHLSGAP